MYDVEAVPLSHVLWIKCTVSWRAGSRTDGIRLRLGVRNVGCPRGICISDMFSSDTHQHRLQVMNEWLAAAMGLPIAQVGPTS
jgi:hypothetical protein